MIQVPITQLPHAEGLKLPAYATPGSAGLDLTAAVAHDTILAPMARMLVPTGIAIGLPAGYEAQARPRSGLAINSGITLLNSPGTIDADYRGEIKVILINLGAEPFVIARGARIAQLVIAPVSRIAWESVESLETSERAGGGFGSTGN